MATFTGAERARCVLLYHETNSATAVQRRFRTEYQKEPPSRPTIYSWHKNFIETGCAVVHSKSPGRPGVSNAVVEQIRETFVRSPRKSTNRASRESGIPQPTVWKVLRKRLHLRPYKLTMVQQISDLDKVARSEFCVEMFERIEADETFLKKIIFSDESTFHVNGKVNTRNCRIWGSEKPHVIIEHVRDSPKVNVFCAVSHFKVYGPFFFMEKTINGGVYLDMLEHFLIPQINQDEQQVPFYFQQDGAPPHFHGEVRAFLDNRFQRRWIGRAGPIAWPPRSPDLTPLDFFLWGFIKDKVYVQPLPANLNDLRNRINAAVAQVTTDMLKRVWQEIDYRWDVCRITNGSHIEPK